MSIQRRGAEGCISRLAGRIFQIPTKHPSDRAEWTDQDFVHEDYSRTDRENLLHKNLNPSLITCHLISDVFATSVFSKHSSPAKQYSMQRLEITAQDYVHACAV